MDKLHFLNKNDGSNELIYNQEKKKLLQLLSTIDEKILNDAELKIIDNEKNQRSTFESFSELEIIYYYIHRKRHVKKGKGISEDTKKKYVGELLYFYHLIKQEKVMFQEDVAEYEDNVWRNLRKRHIRSLQEWLSNQNFAMATLARKLNILKSFLKWLYENDYIKETLHAEFLSTALDQEDVPDRELTYDEVMELLNYYQHHVLNHALLSLLATTGLRIAEVANAKWQDIEYDEQRQQYYLKVRVKGDKWRDTPIAPHIFQRVVAYRERRGLSVELGDEQGGNVFVTRNYKPYSANYMSQYVTIIMEETGLPFTKKKRYTPHFFRHFYASYLYNKKGVQVDDIQEALLHVDRRTTLRYLEKDLKREKDLKLTIGVEEF